MFDVDNLNIITLNDQIFYIVKCYMFAINRVVD